MDPGCFFGRLTIYDGKYCNIDNASDSALAVIYFCLLRGIPDRTGFWRINLGTGAKFSTGRQPVLRVGVLWDKMRPGDMLTLVREPENRYDRYAVRVEWKGHKLGYIPRKNNRSAAKALDSGERLEARILRLQNDSDPWRRVEFEIYLVL